MKKRLVVAEDEPITRMDLKDLLEEAGYDVVGEATDGIDVIQLCKKHKPDLVLMDIKMPFLDGLKAAQVLTSEGIAGGIVLITAFSDREYIDKAKKLGVLGYLVKPLDEKTVVTTIEMALSKMDEIASLKKELYKSNTKLEERKIIEKAKGLIMTHEGLTEDEAFKKIRKLSMDKRSSLKSISEALVLAYD